MAAGQFKAFGQKRQIQLSCLWHLAVMQFLPQAQALCTGGQGKLHHGTEPAEKGVINILAEVTGGFDAVTHGLLRRSFVVCANLS